MKPGWIQAGWPLPETVCAWVTTRAGGVSDGPWGLHGGRGGGLNLGSRCGDQPESVEENRRRLQSALPGEPVWLEQVHGTAVHQVRPGSHVGSPPAEVCADASVTDVAGCVLAVLTADCLPVLLADRDGRRVGVAHAGWRGLSAGVVENTLAALRALPGSSDEWAAWLGPAIGPEAFEVGEEVRQAFVDHDHRASRCFRAGVRPGKWFADLFALARQRLSCAGVDAVGGGDWCTVQNPERFFSYRRDRTSGRMASLIWIKPGS